MQALSLQSIFFFYGIFLYCTCLLMGWLFRGHSDESARLWIAGTLMSAVATSVTAWRAELPDWLGFQAPNVINSAHYLIAALSLRALIGPVPRLSRRLALIAAAALVFGLGLAWLARDHRQALVPYLSLANGLALLVPAVVMMRSPRTAQMPLLRMLLRVVALLGLLWLVRIPVFALGAGTHAMDPKLANWLVFVAMLVIGILLKFGYIGLRFAHAFDNRLALERMRVRLDSVVAERDNLMRLHHAPSGALASQISHEVNQPLAAIRLTLETLARPAFARLTEQQLRELLGDIDRISAALARARALAQGPTPQLRMVSGQELLERLLRAGKAGGLQLCAGPDAPPLQVRADPDLLAAAWVPVLRHLGIGQEHPAVITLAPTDPGRALLRLLAPAGFAQVEAVRALGSQDMVLPHKLQGAPDSDAVLDFLTLLHLASAHAGQLRLSLTASQPPKLQMDLVLPAEADTVQAKTPR